jgi:alpha-L-fucosidase
LANIGPRPDGTLPDDAYRLFDEMAEWMSTHEASVHGITGGGPWPEDCNVPITSNEHTWYFHAMKHQATEENPIVLKNCPAVPLRVSLMRTGEALDYALKDGELRITIPPALKAVTVTDVVKVEFGSDFDPQPYRFTHW